MFHLEGVYDMMKLKMEPKIIYEDEDLLVLDKPAGMTVNSSETTRGERTVQEWLQEQIVSENFVGSPRDFSPSQDFINRSGIVHRLDKETSGILLVAKTQEAFANLQGQFKERRVKKVYIALVHGKVVPAEGEIRVPVGRLPWNRKRFGVLAGGREAVTRYKILNIKYKIENKEKEPLTLLELYPETGRTHQIRVHLKYFGYPIFSDSLYAGRKTARRDRKILSRIFLHASKISFVHPRTGKPLSFESLLPEELNTFLRTLLS